MYSLLSSLQISCCQTRFSKYARRHGITPSSCHRFCNTLYISSTVRDTEFTPREPACNRISRKGQLKIFSDRFRVPRAALLARPQFARPSMNFSTGKINAGNSWRVHGPRLIALPRFTDPRAQPALFIASGSPTFLQNLSISSEPKVQSGSTVISIVRVSVPNRSKVKKWKNTQRQERRFISPFYSGEKSNAVNSRANERIARESSVSVKK